MNSEFSRFKNSGLLIYHGRDLFYLFSDSQNTPTSLSLDDALADGYLVIVCLDKPGQYSLTIANEHYVGAFDGLALILFDWAKSEGYKWESKSANTCEV
jgi:hypothetical protein